MRVAFLLFVFAAVFIVFWAAAPSGEYESVWTMPRWSPYLCGGLIGLLNAMALGLVGDKLGASSQYTTAAGYVERAVHGKATYNKEYFDENPPRIGWGVMLIIGVVLGAFFSAGLSGEFEFELVPPMFLAQFGEAGWLRILTAFLGGAVMSFGARTAGGCTSGHGLSGTSLLNMSSWVALFCFFIGGLIVAFVMY